MGWSDKGINSARRYTELMNDDACPFCRLPPERIVDGDALCLAIYDGFPVSRGHALIIPRRHVHSFFDLTTAERSAMMDLLVKVQSHVQEEHNPAGFNIGINDGSAAGQTVPHVHIHLIPRYEGDISDPRGGVRWVIPHKARYWT
jgi:diadenosine tetraphosphate (Ap4A) HIT family hydrolase